MGFQSTETTTEGDVLIGGEVLIAENEDAVFGQRFSKKVDPL